MNTRPRRDRRRWGLLIVLLFLLTFCFVGVALFSLGENGSHSPQWLPVALRSKLAADYGVVANPTGLVALEWNLIEDSIRDDRSRRDDAPERIATLSNQMQTPVHNVMPRTPTPTIQPTPTEAPTYRIPPFALTPSILPTPSAPNSVPTSESGPAPTGTVAPQPTAADVTPAPIGTPAPSGKPTKEPRATTAPKPTQGSSPNPVDPPKPPKEPRPSSIDVPISTPEPKATTSNK